MSKLETNTIDTVSGTSTLQVGSTNTSTITLGVSGDTINVPSGVTIANSGTATGFAANTPAFAAKMNGTQSVSHNTSTKIEVDTELYDTNSGYNTSTYRFTPGVAGKYLVTWNIYCDGGGQSNLRIANAQIYVNGTLSYISGYDKAAGYENNGRESLSAVITLDDNDYIEPYFYAYTQNSAAVTIGGGTHTYDALFAAHRLIGV